jgi:hypothetical protein
MIVGSAALPARGCPVCGIPLDSQVFDASGIVDLEKENAVGRRHLLARFELPAQYCGVLEYFAQFTDAQARDPAEIDTPALEWSILINGRPLYPYLAFTLILNPWGFGSFQTTVRLNESATLEFIVRKTRDAIAGETVIKKAGARIVGRYWYDAEYGRVGRPY